MLAQPIHMKLKKAAHEFSLGQLVAIFEDANMTITSFSTAEQEASIMMDIQFVPGALSACLASLRRYNYEIIFVAGEDLYTEQLEEHAAYLNTFLNI